MKARCAKCGDLRSKLGLSFAHCDQKPVCALVDPTLLQWCPPKRGDLESLVTRTATLRDNMATLHVVARTVQIPLHGKLGVLARGYHALLFKDVGLSWSGRWRVDGEEAHFGPISMGNGLQGLPHDRIDAAIDELDRSIPFFPSETKEEFLRTAARLMHGFFAIHPFCDGNGRVARALLQTLSGGTDYALSFTKGMTARSNRKYVSALRYADKCKREALETTRPRDPYAALVRWLEQFVSVDEAHGQEADEPL